MKSKLIALYLPQFHEIDENNLWWGKGYTEWDAVKNAKPLFRGHLQPNVPLNDNYYDLSDISAKTWKWQSKLAKEYGVYGFCIYHYWFDIDSLLLQRPMEILFDHPEIDINYCVCWANESWSRNWYGLQREVLKEQKYSTNSYIAQFNYLLKFFKDSRYIKIDNKPVVCIYRSDDILDLETLKSIWSNMARDNGFGGVYIVSAKTGRKVVDNRETTIDAYYDFQPGYSINHKVPFFKKIPLYFRKSVVRTINTIFHKKNLEEIIDSRIIYSSFKRKDINLKKNNYPGLFAKWDNTPRRLNKGSLYLNTTPSFFEKQIATMLFYGEKQGFNMEFVFINAWNEWGEGCYLEPDCKYKFEYLKVIAKFFK